MNIRENVPISEVTTMRIGGNAKFLIEAEEEVDVFKAYRFAEVRNLPVFALGGGANCIGRDEGFDGVLVRNQIKGIEILNDEDELLIEIGGGEVWDDFVAFACDAGLTGVEAMSGIPGTVGAAPVQNIGAYGQEISQVIDSVVAYDPIEGGVVEIPASDMQMGYRRTMFNFGPEAGRYFILRVRVKLSHGEIKGELYRSLASYLDENGISARDPQTIREAVLAVRNSKLPDPAEIPSAGSFFKNAFVDETTAERLAEAGITVRDGKVNTGKLIEEAGLSGMEFYGFKVCPTAALVLMNVGNGNYAGLDAAREEIRTRVFNEFGVELEQEPVEISGGLSVGSMS